MRNYNEFMTKTASRKWKEMIGTLSPENEKRLVKANILNYHREAKGLNEGSRRIASKYNIKINNDGKLTRTDRARIRLSQEIYDPYKLKASNYMTDNNPYYDTWGKVIRDHRRKIDSGAGDKWSKDIIDNMKATKGKRRLTRPNGKFEDFYDSLSSQVITNKNGSLSAIVRHNPDYFDRVRSTARGGKYEKITKNSDLKYQNNALTLRHEIDEARTRMKQRKEGRGSAVNSIYETHAAPSVIHRESANVSTLHPLLRQYWTESNSRQDNPGHRTPAMILKRHGVEYGKSGKFNRRAAAKNDKEYYEARLRG